jgi:hypothetical protein
MYRPACRKNHTGVLSTGRRRHALKNLLPPDPASTELTAALSTIASLKRLVLYDLLSLASMARRANPLQPKLFITPEKGTPI